MHFGFQYTDIDQVLQWEGALDYAAGIFREPYFYGQNYNYMVESLVAVPLIWLKIPVHMAVPTASSFLAIFPFVVLALFFYRRKLYFWSYLTLIFPLFLPLEYNFLTTMPRGFMQAGLFLPLLYYAVFDPEKPKSVTLFFIGAGVCFLANPGSVIFIVPIGMYLFSYHFRSPRFYWKVLLLLPSLILLWLSNQYYVLHPHKLLLKLDRIDLQISTLIQMLKRNSLFEYLMPLNLWGQLFLLILLGFVVYLGVKKRTNDFLFVFFTVAILLFSLSVPKVSFGEASSGVFYSSSRLFVQLPVLILLVFYLVFQRTKLVLILEKKKFIWLTSLVIIAGVSFSFKNFNVNHKAKFTAKATTFPVESIPDLFGRIQVIDSIAKKHKADLMVTDPVMGWPFGFISFTYASAMHSMQGERPKMQAVHNVGDRRSWIYKDTQKAKRILLYVMFIDEKLLEGIDHKQVGVGLLLIYNNTLTMDELFKKLHREYGNKNKVVK